MTRTQAFALAQKLWGPYAGAWDMGDNEWSKYWGGRYRIGETMTGSTVDREFVRLVPTIQPVGRAPSRGEFGRGWAWNEAFYAAACARHPILRAGKEIRLKTPSATWRQICRTAHSMHINLRRPGGF